MSIRMSQPNGEITSAGTSAELSVATPTATKTAGQIGTSIGAEFHVIGLLTQLYTAGEMPTPSPLTTLGARTMHSLYAGSFIVYSINLACDWFHTYAACQGWTVSFPLKPWLVIVMVCSCFAGSILLFLLFYLCIENALLRRYDLEPFSGGFLMIIEKFGSWLTAFSCFRIAFLVLLLEDLPLSFANFWLLSACRLCSTYRPFWPLLLSCLSSILSLLWRSIMLYYSYKHYWFFGSSQSKWSSPPPVLQVEKGNIQKMKEIIGLDSDKMSQYDECWPVRFSMWSAFKRERGTSWIRVALNETPVTNFVSPHIDDDSNASVMEHHIPPTNICRYTFQALNCCCMTVLLYIGLCFTGCIPCCYHYSCKRNAKFHRNRFSRTCTRSCTSAFHGVIIVFSCITTISLLAINLIYISSVQVVGHNSIPPELSHMCVELNLEERRLHASIRPYSHPFFNQTHFFECKPIFEFQSGVWGFQWQRTGPEPWKRVLILNNVERLIFWVDVQLEWEAEEPVVYVDFVSERMTRCNQFHQSGWTLDLEHRPLPLPYFLACYGNYKVVAANKLTCDKVNSDDSPVYLITMPTVPAWPPNVSPPPVDNQLSLYY